MAVSDQELREQLNIEMIFNVLEAIMYHSRKQTKYLIKVMRRIDEMDADLEAGFKAVEDVVNKAGTDLAKMISDWQANPSVSKADIITRLGTIATNLTNFDASIVAADPVKAPPIVPPASASGTVTGQVQNNPKATT